MTIRRLATVKSEKLITHGGNISKVRIHILGDTESIDNRLAIVIRKRTLVTDKDLEPFGGKLSFGRCIKKFKDLNLIEEIITMKPETFFDTSKQALSLLTKVKQKLDEEN